MSPLRLRRRATWCFAGVTCARALSFLAWSGFAITLSGAGREGLSTSAPSLVSPNRAVRKRWLCGLFWVVQSC